MNRTDTDTGEWTTTAGLRWRAIKPFGLELDRDLRKPLTDEQSRAFLDLFDREGLMVARGQELDMEQQAAVTALLGRSATDEGKAFISSEDNRSGGRGELTFHSDYAFSEHPLEAISLHAVDVVDGASSTVFASAARAFDTLPAALRDALEQHQAQMIIPGNFGGGAHAYLTREPDMKLMEQRGCIIADPRNGRWCLRVNELQTAALSGMAWEESRDRLTAVFAHLYGPENTVEHVWHRGDIVLWDNFMLQHARGSLADAGRRILQRVSTGEKSLSEHCRPDTARSPGKAIAGAGIGPNSSKAKGPT